MTDWKTTPRQVLGPAPATATYRFQPPGPVEVFCGWYLSLIVTNADPASRSQASVRAWDGLPQSQREDNWVIERADLLEGLTRIFVPFPSAEVTFINLGANNTTVQARGVIAKSAGPWPGTRYLYNFGTVQALAGGGAFNQFQVPAGATHYRPRFTTDVGAFDVEERPAAGVAAIAAYSSTTKGTGESRDWLPLCLQQTPGSDRQIALSISGAAGPSAAVEFQYDLTGSHR